MQGVETGAMAENDAETFAARLRRVMRQYGIRTQRELAELSGIDVTYLNRIINGRIDQPTFETVRRLADALGVPIGLLAPQYINDRAPAERQPVPTVFTDAFSELDLLTDDEVITYVESKPGEYFRRQMAIQKERRTRASYVNLCRAIMRAWTSNAQLAIDASLVNEH